MHYFEKYLREITIPIAERSQIDTNLINKITEVAKCRDIFFSDSNTTKIPSIAPIPAGNIVKAPNSIEV